MIEPTVGLLDASLLEGIRVSVVLELLLVLVDDLVLPVSDLFVHLLVPLIQVILRVLEPLLLLMIIIALI